MKKLTYTLIAIGILNIQAHQTLKQIYRPPKKIII
jgi:hypothetical protein